MQDYCERITVQDGPRLPLEGSLDLTYRCNNACIHCRISLPAGDPIAKQRALITATLKSSLTEAASLGCFSVRFTGGEPRLREDFEELYLHARQAGLKESLFTDATLVTLSLADLFSGIPPLEEIEISVYGMKKASYEAATRTPGSFDEAWRGIHPLLEKNAPFVVKSSLLPPNEQEVEAFEAWDGSDWGERTRSLSRKERGPDKRRSVS